MIFFEFLRILEKNRKKGKPENLGKHGLLRRSVGNPRCGVALCRSVGCPRHSEAEVPKWHLSGTLRRSEVLRRSIVMLRCCVDTIHYEKIFGFLFPNTSYSYTDSLRTLIND